MKIKKQANGNYYIEKTKGHTHFKDLTLFRATPRSDNNGGRIDLHGTYVPKELIGKRFRLYVEIEDESI